ncbi:hypothetical protein CDIK_2769 [Cucumispora dikerogammari]|nr:hypothetical protein CDIK_2769 [Cucumispora dikerogammari]
MLCIDLAGSNKMKLLIIEKSKISRGFKISITKAKSHTKFLKCLGWLQIFLIYEYMTEINLLITIKPKFCYHSVTAILYHIKDYSDVKFFYKEYNRLFTHYGPGNYSKI